VEDPGAVTFNAPGTYTVTFTVTDALGLADPTPDTRVITVVANQAPNGVIDSPAGNVTVTAGQSVTFAGTGATQTGTCLSPICGISAAGAPNRVVEDPGAVTFNTPGTYTVTFTVTDALGLADPTPDARVITVVANQAPNGVIDSPAGNVTVAVGQSVTFAGRGATRKATCLSPTYGPSAAARRTRRWRIRARSRSTRRGPTR